jgi:hypothetical protein
MKNELKCGQYFLGCALSVASLALLTGCMSVRYTTTLPPGTHRDTSLGDLRVNIVSVSDPPTAKSSLTHRLFARGYLMQIGREKYPQIFSDVSGALPVNLWISGRVEEPAPSISLGIFICTLGILPLSDSTQYKVSLRAISADEQAGLVLDQSADFQCKGVCWSTVFSPLGLLVPGHSDIPRDFAVGPNIQMGAKKSMQRLVCETCVEAVVQALLKGDLARMQAACRSQATRVSIEHFNVAGEALWCRRVARATNAPTDPVPDMLLGELYLTEPGPRSTPIETVPIARRISADTWQTTPFYLEKMRTLCRITAVLDKGKPVRAEVTEIRVPPLEDFLDITCAADDVRNREQWNAGQNIKLMLRRAEELAPLSPSSSVMVEEDFNKLRRAGELASLPPSASAIIENARWRTRILLQAKTSTLPTLLKNNAAQQLQALLIKTEQAVLNCTHEADLAKNRAQQAVENGSDPSKDREWSLVYNEHLAVLNAIVAAIKEELANRQR